MLPRPIRLSPHRAAAPRAGASAARVALVWTACAVAGAAQSQALDAGRVYGGLPQRLPLAAPVSAPGISIVPHIGPSSVMPAAVSPLMVKAFRIDGAQRLALPKLEALVQPYAGRALSVSQLQAAADAVSQAYRDAGYSLAQAAVLPQTVVDGVVTITVREGQLERLDIAAAPATGSVPAAVQSGLQHTLRLGEPVNTLALAQTLLLINNLPGAGRAGAQLAPGAAADGTLVSARYSAAQRVAGHLLADNGGNRHTRRARAMVSLRVAEPFGLADQLSVTGLATGNPLQYLQADYRVPLGLRATVGGAASRLRYKLCCEPAGQGGEGNATTVSLQASYQALLSPSHSLAWFATLDQRQFESHDQAGATTDREVVGLSLGARGQGQTGNFSSWSLLLRAGLVDLSASPNDLAADTLAARIDGGFSKLSGHYARSQALGGGWTGLFNARAQANLGRNLESSERFTLGGPDGVRGYPLGEGIGDSGWLASAELRYALAQVPGLSAAGFIDAGGVRRLSKNETALAANLPNRYELGSMGLGLHYDHTAVNLLLAVARPIGGNRGADSAGSNHEGQKDGARAWVRSSWRF